MVIVINSVIGGFSWVDLAASANSPITLSDYTVRLQLYRVTSEI